MTVGFSGSTAGKGYSLKSSFSRRSKRLGVISLALAFSLSLARTFSSLGSPRISPRSQRLLVIQ